MTSEEQKPELSNQSPKNTFRPDSAQTEDVTLRKKAEELLRSQRINPPEEIDKIPTEEIRLKLQELQIYQLELEMQNDELRRAHAETHAAKAHYFKFYDLAPVGYCTLNEEGLITEVNLTLVKFLGLSKSAVLNRLITSYIFPEDQDTYYLHRKKLLKSMEPQACELRLIGKQGSLLWARMDANLIEDKNGSFICQIVLSNITEQKRLEEEKNKIEARYQQAQRMESVGTLAGGLAHDFNNKLTVILGCTEMIMTEIGPANSIFADLEQIHLATMYSADLTRQLLAFARKQKISPKNLDLNETLSEMLKMLRRLIGENINLVWLPKKNLWPVKMDASQIDQILANLFVNARDAIAGVGEIIIETDQRVVDESYCAELLDCLPGEYVVLTVTDNGCGMDKETRNRIFEPFFTTKELGKGTGLGLASVSGVIKQNHGFINVYSEPGIGTTFKVYLPRQVNETTQTSTKSVLKPNKGSSATILLVEDEEAILNMTSRQLQEFGYSVLAANTPNAALRLAEEFAGKIDLILTDIIMPEMTGWELTQKILSAYPGLKSLFMSGYAFDTITQQGYSVSKEQFLQKPFLKNELAAKVHETLKDTVVKQRLN